MFVFVNFCYQWFILQNSEPHKFAKNDCSSSGIFTTEKCISSACAGESSPYPEESSATIAMKQNTTNAQLPAQEHHNRSTEAVVQSGSSSSNNSNSNNILYLNSRKTLSDGLCFTLSKQSASFTSNHKAHLSFVRSSDTVILPNSSSHTQYTSRSNRPRSFYDNVC